MKTVFISLFLFSFGASQAQKDTIQARAEIARFQAELNEEYRDPGKSPLEPQDLKHFRRHDFFPVDLSFRVTARLALTQNEPVFRMKTTGSSLPQYRKFGELHFTLHGQQFKLNVYQSLDLLKTEVYKDYLFLPFTDLTNDSLTYGGGRYIDLRLPVSEQTMVIDFNQAYNPYCAYNHHRSCPVVPSENHLHVEVRAGVRLIRKD